MGTGSETSDSSQSSTTGEQKIKSIKLKITKLKRGGMESEATELTIKYK